ncbi:chemotaxis protein CheA [Sulfitobacter guttiformis]|nr:chemotaxis protein CheA [Sulfitobacter guttiformis]
MFFDECSDLMESLFEGLTRLEEGVPEEDTVNAVFRAVHSIKGGAGAFKLADLVLFAHKFETVLDELRSGRLEQDDKLIPTMLRAADHLTHLVEVAQSESEINHSRGTELLAELNAYVDASVLPEAEFTPMAMDFDTMFMPPTPNETLEIEFRPHAKLYHNGHDPLLLIDALHKQGALSVAIDLDAITRFENYDPDAPTLKFKLTFLASEAKRLIKENFEFVDGICDLTITEFTPEIAVVETAAAQSQPDPLVVEPSPTKALDTSPKTSGFSGRGEPANATLRVELEKVDRLINTVGELIINQAMVNQRIEQLNLANDSDLWSDMADYKVLARDLQEGVMSIRAQPVKPLFQRMARITREAADTSKKSVRLVQVGENTEVDKTVIERLADPLTHMIRNAVDHGLENGEGRKAAGKAEVGTITLSARHMSGNLMIEVADDGGGLNRDRILDIAISKGLVPRNAELQDGEIDKLLFLPGFSTNKEVSELSGRGVGMDVVKTAVQALGGRIAISSALGKGTTFAIVLPLTLAVVEGIVISVAGETMIVPITAVLETFRPKKSEIFRLASGGRVLSIRGEYVPIVSVAGCLGFEAGMADPQTAVLVLVENMDHSRFALEVDSIHDQRQVVIKSVSGDYGTIPGVSAATIMGNGQIALILDVDHLSNKENVVASMPPPPSQTASMSNE